MRARWRSCAWRLALCAAGLGAALTAAGCARCSDEPRVPFKLPGAHGGDPPEAGIALVDAGPPARTFEPPVDRPELSGSVVALSRVHATLESDLDGDGDRDLLVLAHDAQQEPRLYAALREPVGFAAPQAVTQFTQAPAPGCGLGTVRLDALSTTKAVANITRTCGSDAAPDVPRASLWLLSLEPTPRVFERIDLPGPDAAAPALAGRARSVDADGDGHDDVAIDFSVEGAGGASGPSEAVPLVWLDRPSGLVRDGREPDATLALWASGAQAVARKQPDFALARTQLALTLARALCRELGAPRVRVSGAAGVACGALASSGALLRTALGANVQRGALGPAFDAYRSLRTLDPPAEAKLLQEAGAALLALRAAPGVSLRRLGAVDTVRAPRLHLPSARFLSDASLYVRRSPPVLIDLDRNEETPAPARVDDLVRDPGGQLIAAAIERGCEGPAVRIERAPPRGSDYVTSPALALASITSAAPATGCGRPGGRADDDGYSLLGWAPQGLLVVRGSELRLVPLGADGRPLGAPRVLAPDAPRPAPIAAGIATSDASRWVEPTPAGVLLYGPRSTDVALLRPDGFTGLAKGPLEAAVSPTGRRVALIAGASVYLLERP